MEVSHASNLDPNTLPTFSVEKNPRPSSRTYLHLVRRRPGEGIQKYAEVTLML